MISLKEAVKFHGHLGPYLILCLIAGEIGLKELGCRIYFGLTVKVYGANMKPKSCLIDGLQLSTGATYGKGNIQKFKAASIKVCMINPANKKTIQISLKKPLVSTLNDLQSHAESERFARKLLKMRQTDIFELK
jgi:formylmethanofuran dehydrogenase subunit E